MQWLAIALDATGTTHKCIHMLLHVRRYLRPLIYRSHLSRGPLKGDTIIVPLVVKWGGKLEVPYIPFSLIAFVLHSVW